MKDPRFDSIRELIDYVEEEACRRLAEKDRMELHVNARSRTFQNTKQV